MNLKNNLFSTMCLVMLFLTSCVNDHDDGTCTPAKIAVHVSVQEKYTQNRASDLLAIEKIKRYDIFIYDSSTGNLIDYKGKYTPIDSNDFSEDFLAGSDYLTTKDVYVVVNYDGWNGYTEEQMKGIAKVDLEAMEMACIQNYTGELNAMTGFTGYENASGNESFVMSACVKRHNFQTTPTLNMNLKRAYAKVILKVMSSLPEGEDNTDWISLKSVSIKRISNVAKETRMFLETGDGYKPEKANYVWNDEYEKSGDDADLRTGYEFDTFQETTIKLRIFPHTPTGESERTSIGFGFKVGPAGKDIITKDFFRTIEIGSADTGYRIDPNYAYIVTIRYGKTDSSVSVDCQVTPWNYIYFDEEVTPQ